MGDKKVDKNIVNEIIFWGKELYDKELVISTSGNISIKVNNKIYITAHNAYLGYLNEDNIILLDEKGNILEGKGEPTTEKKLHLSIYENLPDKNVVIHAHPSYTSYFYNYFDKLETPTFEEKLYLGNIGIVPQNSPTVVDVKPVINAFDINSIVVLKRHGVVAAGKDFKSVFSLIYLLENNAKLNLICNSLRAEKSEKPKDENKNQKKYKLFSEEHINALTDIINNDEKAQNLGKEYNLTTILTVKDNDTIISFHYKNGKIIEISHNDKSADFIFSANKNIWRQIFNRENDPFVAYSQGKIKLKGDFNKLSTWFPVFERTFELWGLAPVE